MQAEEIAVKEKSRKKSGDDVLPELGRLLKGGEQIGKIAERARGKVRAASAKQANDNARLVKIVRVVFGAKFEGTVKNHPACSLDDLALVRSYGFHV